MKSYNDLLREYQIKPISYLKKGRSIIINTKDKKYVIKEKIKNSEIYEYLKNRSFKYFPEILASNDLYELTEYFEEVKLPDEQKYEELIKLIAVLHSKTTYYDKVDIAYYKEIYEDLKNNVLYLKSYYADIIALIDTKEFMSPSEYLFARNYTIIINSLNYVDVALEKWYQMVENSSSTRIVVLHNNLSLEHLVCGQKNILLSWRKSKFGNPIFDLLTIFRNYGNKYNFKSKLEIYESIYPLKKEELELLYIFMILPPKIEFKGSEYNLCEMLTDKIELLYQASKIVSPNQFENSKENN